MNFRSVKSEDIPFLYELLKEFSELLGELQIKQEIPSFKQHEAFVKKFLGDFENHPYKAWYIVEDAERKIGSFSIKESNEFGYNIKKKYQGKGLGVKAFELFFKIHSKEEIWARTNSKNLRSQNILKKFGFVLTNYEFHHIKRYQKE